MTFELSIPRGIVLRYGLLFDSKATVFFLNRIYSAQDIVYKRIQKNTTEEKISAINIASVDIDGVKGGIIGYLPEL